jgi:endonuclease G
MASRNYKFLALLILFIFKFIFKHPWALSFLLLIPVGLYSYEVLIARPALSFKGIPQTQNGFAPSTWTRVLRSEAFLVGYSDIKGNPLWVTYKIQAVPTAAKRLKRPSRFKADWRSFNEVTHADYTGSGYDRGHMAPNYAISRLYGKQAQLETFFMTNITPQKPNLNRKLWQRLEAAEISHFTQLSEAIWVTTGTVFTGDTKTLKKASNVEIPDAFYKIYAAKPPNKGIKLLAFLIPQNVKGNESLAQFLVSIDTIEAVTGLDFFSELEDTLEDTLEATIMPKPWKLNEVSTRPSRF